MESSDLLRSINARSRKTLASGLVSNTQDKRTMSRRMLKKAVQQGHRRVETGGVPFGVR
jgi:hypothetical protein